MERASQAFDYIASRVARIGTGYLAFNVVLLIEEARWHLIYRLTLWDIAEMKTFAFLLGKTLHP